MCTGELQKRSLTSTNKNSNENSMSNSDKEKLQKFKDKKGTIHLHRATALQKYEVKCQV